MTVLYHVKLLNNLLKRIIKETVTLCFVNGMIGRVNARIKVMDIGKDRIVRRPLSVLNTLRSKRHDVTGFCLVH